MKHSRALIFIMILALSQLALFAHPAQVLAESPTSETYPYQIYLPISFNNSTGGGSSVPSLPSLDSFVSSVQDGQVNVVKGVYVNSVLALQVVQQPEGNAAFVSSQSNVATEFSLARIYGVTGLLAHNSLGGKDFFKLNVGQTVQIVMGDGTLRAYRIESIASYQALEPNSTTSDFLDLTSGQVLDAADIFSLYYMGGDHVTFQTCIARDGIGSWGRLFVIAVPVI